MKHLGDCAGAREFVHVSEISKCHLRAEVMESGPASRVVASTRPSGSSDRHFGGFSSIAAPSPLSPVPADCKPSAPLMTGIYPEGLVPALRPPSLMPSARPCLSRMPMPKGGQTSWM